MTVELLQALIVTAVSINRRNRETNPALGLSEEAASAVSRHSAHANTLGPNGVLYLITKQIPQLAAARVA